jgi:hypothetical protein
MTKVIIISEGNLDSFYEQTLQYFQDVYHNYPTSLTGKSISENEYARISHYDSAASNHASSIDIPVGINLGKTVF